MKTKLAIALSLLLSTSAMAHQENEFNCNVNIQQSVKVTPNVIEVLDGEKRLFSIDNGSALYSNGKQVHLNDEQQALVEEYSAMIQELAPEVAGIIADALIIAKTAVSGVITELFGDDVQLQDKVNSIIEKFEQKAAPMMNQAEGEYYLVKESLDNAGDDFSKEIEQEVESLLKESGGQMLILLGKMMMNGEDGMKDFETKMEAFGESMEQQGNALETRANAMCQRAIKLDEIETRMQKAIPQFADYDLVTLDHI